MKNHWHLYRYKGRSYTDSEIRKGVAPPDYPPFLIADWLRRPSKHAEITTSDVSVGVDWLRTWMTKHVPVDAVPREDGCAYFPVEKQVEYARQRMCEEVGKDVVKGYYTAGGHFVSLALISCPRLLSTNPREELPACPTGGTGF